MPNHLAHIALIIDDYDKAIDYYTKVLQFKLLEDTRMSENKRWVLIEPSENSQTSILLAKASTPEQHAIIGKQTGGRVFLFLKIDHFDSFHEHLISHHVTIIREPVNEPWGKVLVLEDLYGNLWDVIEPLKS